MAVCHKPCFRCNAPNAPKFTSQCLSCIEGVLNGDGASIDVLKDYGNHFQVLQMCSKCEAVNVVGISMLACCQDCYAGRARILPLVAQRSDICAMCNSSHVQSSIKICLYCFLRGSFAQFRQNHLDDLRQSFTRIVGCTRCTLVKNRNPYKSRPGFEGLRVCNTHCSCDQ